MRDRCETDCRRFILCRDEVVEAFGNVLGRDFDRGAIMAWTISESSNVGLQRRVLVAPVVANPGWLGAFMQMGMW